MFHLILYEPEIPPNTGNVIRLAANAGATLHLIRPLGFELDDARLRRAGLDYAELAVLQVHDSWSQLLATGTLDEGRIWAFSTRAGRCHAEARFAPGDALLFGPESRGLPEEMLADRGPRRCLRIPMRAGSRSLNLSNSVAVALYEALRQNAFDGLR